MNTSFIASHEPRTFRGLANHYLRDLVYGAIDGIITTFAVVAGVAGAELSGRTVLILGVANLIADGFSMGAGNYLGIRSEEAAKRANGEPPVEPFALRHGAATFGAFLLAGAVPLIPYLFGVPVDSRFTVAVVLTLTTLFVVGALRTYVTRLGWWRSGMEMLLVGAGAALLSYVVGKLLANFADVPDGVVAQLSR